jgi:hypothetical protein
VRVGAIFGIVLGTIAVQTAATAADLFTKAPAAQWALPAVDGLNGKAEGFGGSLAHHGIVGGAASFSVPVAQQFGFQADGLAASYRGDFLGGVAGHGFWRDPSKGLLGFYGDYIHSDRLGSNVGHFGAEGAIYFGKYTLEGVVGVESGNNRSATFGGLVETVNFSTRVFDKVDLAYYLTDDLKFAIGHRYYGGRSQLALGGEWAFAHINNASPALFVEGRVGGNDSSSIWGGLRVYFGQKPKSLIRRHREDDPPAGVSDSAAAFGNAGTSTPAPNTAAAGIVCPPGRILVGGVCVGL